MATKLPISTVVQINITRTPAIAQQVDFGLACFITPNVTKIPISTRYKIYDNLTEVEADFADTTDEYAMAASFFGQSPRPTKLMFASVDAAATPTPETYVHAITDAYSKVQFYALAIVNLAITDTIVKSIAAWVETQTMLFFWQSPDVAILDSSSTTDIAAALQALDYDRTSVIYCDAALAERVDAAELGMGIPRQVGTFNWMYRQLVGITATSATASQINVIKTKACNVYTNIGGNDCLVWGFTSGQTPTYIDQLQAQDWLYISLQTAIFAALITLPKIPYTDPGVISLENIVYSILEIGVQRGIIAATPKPTVTADSVIDVPADQRAQRVAPTIYFDATLSGCIDDVVVDGTLAV